MARLSFFVKMELASLFAFTKIIREKRNVQEDLD